MTSPESHLSPSATDNELEKSAQMPVDEDIISQTEEPKKPLYYHVLFLTSVCSSQLMAVSTKNIESLMILYSRR